MACKKGETYLHTVPDIYVYTENLKEASQVNALNLLSRKHSRSGSLATNIGTFIG
jgi:hypothetical protein